MTSAMTLFTNRPHSRVLEVSTATQEFEEDAIQ